jgi:hypothetical protein
VTPPARFKDPSDFTPEEHHRRQRDPGYHPESDDYIAARAKALTDAGLEVDRSESDAERPLDELSPEDHFDRISRR